ncbi:hypothetical protein B0I35DRAFT_109122 [Stachybotrys elegans]|uniref:protein disulfide-isomerase n=1 Tax=Stachybotrys elegans TaxID=80388 RepID=A0A8K0SBN0_9HYPO|nr:hypothetical protein B0I35DRAFT_109122 [Stachybotrys elegans]
MHQPTLLATIAAVLAALPAAQAAGLYTKSSPVLQVDGRSYDKLIAKSNHTSIVEFYAPWCGHCQNLKPAYEKAARNLEGLAKVAAVNCDEESNKQLCGAMGVQGFPTLKLVRPSKKAGGRPVVEDYQGQRTASAITDAVVKGINNHVTKVTDKDLDAFLANESPKALLFTDKGTTSALLRSVAIDFLDVIAVGQVRNKEAGAVEKFSVDKFPTLVLIPTEGEPIVYDGEMKKTDIVEFLKQVGQPNPDPAPPKKKTEKKTEKKASSSSTDEAKEEAAPKAEEPAETTAEEPTLEDQMANIIPIDPIMEQSVLVKECLHTKAQTCVLVLIPPQPTDPALEAVTSLSKIKTKYIHSKRHMFPFYAIPTTLEGGDEMREALNLNEDVEIIAINARRGWWRRYSNGFKFDLEAVEAWIDAIRLGEGEKMKLPEGLVVELPKEPEPEAEEPKAESESTEATQATDPEPEAETEAPKAAHDEL